MSHYDKYKHLLGRRYIDGKWDCYGLAVDYYKDVWGLELVNAARPTDWWLNKDFDMINLFMSVDGWKLGSLNVRMLRPGDGLMFACAGGKTNHVGIYVGNGSFIHHFYKHLSREDALLEKWTSRLTGILKHDHVVHARESNQVKTPLVEILPHELKR